MPIVHDIESTLIEQLDPRLGTVLSERYRLEHKLAAGGFGAVYAATDLVENRDVAVKVLHKVLASDPVFAARFQREMEALSSLSNPHTVAALDAGNDAEGTPYIVMELLTGFSVFDVYKASGVMPWRRVVHIIRGACISLAEAHALGIIHRDLKPENIHLERRGNDADYVKVLDFGIARIFESSVLDNTTLTRAGQMVMVGTFDYMPPEQIIGESAAQSDIFTLGVVMYELCSGRRPYGETKAPAAQLAAILAGPPPLLDQVPDKLALVIARCIECDPANRYADAGELLAALTPFVEGAEPPIERARAVRRNAPVPPPRPTPPGQSALMSPSPVPRQKQLPRHKQMTLPGVQPSIARGSGVALEALQIDLAPRLASGTAPISDQPRVTNPFAEKLGTTNATGIGLSSFDAPNWRAVMLAVAFAAALIVLGLLV